MRKPPPLTALLLLLLMAAGPAFAGKSGGRSYSSGGKSFSGGRSSSFGSRSSPSPAGRSYSSGGKTSPVAPAAARPGPSVSRPGKTSPAAPAGGARPAPSPVAPGRTAGLGGAPRVGGRTYSSGEGASAPAGARPPGVGYDTAAGAAQRRQESKQAYVRGTQPKPTYTDGKGESRPLDPRDQRAEQLRRQLDYERWVNRQQRERQFYQTYYPRPVVVYHDPYSSFFWWWLLDRSLDQRALWAYHHRGDMDPARYQALMARDAALEARVRQLEAGNRPRDPTYTPSGLDSDLMYTDDYVNAAYNPQPVAPPRPHGHHGVMVFVTIVLVLLLLAAVVWLVFFKRWNVS